MDIQDHGKNHPSGHESHGGVHLCHKCGWPFPNPHPSAKQRRSHKRICGTIEGYKLIDSRDIITHSTPSDEEPLSDESHKTPCAQVPKVMESCSLEKNIGGIGAMSNKSEDEVFSDAAMEFQDGGFGLGRLDSFNHPSKSDKDLTPVVSFKDCEDTCDVIPIKMEPLTDVLEESSKVGGGDKMAEYTVRQETNAEKIEKMLDGISDLGQLEEDFSDRLASKTSINENAEQESDGKGHLGISLERNLTDVVASNRVHAYVTSEKTDDITPETRLVDRVVKVKENDDKLPLNTVINDLSAKEESGKDIDASTYNFQIPTDAAQDSTNVCDKTEKENVSVYALKHESFKDHNTVKLPQSRALASEEIIVDEEDEVKDLVSQEKCDTLSLKQLDKDNEADASCIHVAEDSYKLGGNKEELVEGKSDVIQLDKGSDTLGCFVDDDTTKNKTDLEVCYPEEKQPVLVSHTDVETRKLNNVCGSDDMDVPQSGRNGAHITEDENTGRIDDENYVKKTLTLNESTNGSSLSQTNPSSNLLDVENSASESFSLHHDSPVAAKEANDEYTRALPETEGPHLNRASNSLDDMKESEISRDIKLQGECVGKDLMTSAVNNIEGNEFEKTSQDQLKKDSIHSPSFAEPTGRISGAVDDSHTGESGVDASGTSTLSLQGEADNGSIKPQLDAPVGDVLKSSSHNDSLAGQWGSVSVSSMQSDNPAAINTENLSPTGSHPLLEPEKANINKPSAVLGEKHFHKSDEFEPPSFMTLVEPGGSNQNVAAASEIQTTQNSQHAGWFPSITHAANESQGRKKEEIIAKVNNWNTMQHTPLKSLLGEAINETKPKSPNSTKAAPRDEKITKDNGGMVTKVSSILGPESPEAEPSNVEKWDSPARYQADIKREKRKMKGRPLWTQFVCCSSAN
ncbi:uncharacterized protein LOC108453981 [Gossypium arboreum]|uniref:C2H2-type domain-containing protein n=1 Tax=Gossypium arboreum TaxID=29729 RepID=A0ABR0NTY5_GOSAR|nr:uncharacterized protein LOC108453981 [Gossypium arboreum]KAK5804839.1 hypothetical protein PVK06_032490 [Gossypium arboreum]